MPTAEEEGQSSVEAAMLLPILLGILFLLLQPLCLFYSLTVMEATAGEMARLIATRHSSLNDFGVRQYAERRLGAIPEIEIFHTGGVNDWVVETSGNASSQEVTVKLTGHAKPMLGLGALMDFAGITKDGKIELHVESTEKMRPAWLGGGYNDWIGMWG